MNNTIKTFVYNQTNLFYISPIDIDETTINSIDDNTIAYLSWCSYGTTMTILKLYVNNCYYHQGYGTYLLKHAIKQAKDSCYFTIIELDDMSDNVWNLDNNIYIKCGFTYKNPFPFPEMELVLPIGNLTSSFENMELNNM